jgi:GNAT superfamily N-acetyltransferase
MESFVRFSPRTFSSVRIRSAALTDTKVLAAIHHAGVTSLAEWLPADYTTGRNARDFLQIWSELQNAPSNFHIFAAENDGSIAGIACIAYVGPDGSPYPKDTAEIHRLYVDPPFKRNGIGGALLEYCLHHLRDLGRDRVVLWVFEENEPARHFYEKHGLQLDGNTKTLYGQKQLRYAIALNNGKRTFT